MKTGKLLNKWVAALCAVLLMLSLFAIPVFAEETTTEETTTEETTTEETTTEETTTEETTTEETTTEGTTTGETTTNTTGNNQETPASTQGLSTAAIIWIVVGAILLIVGVVLAIKFREKITKGLRVYKSEFGKVSWLSWDQTKKSTLVVIVVLLICAAAICLLDFGLSKGFIALVDAFANLFA